MAGRLPSPLAALAIALVAAACGEDVDFGAAPGGDAGARDAALDRETVDAAADAPTGGDAAPCSDAAASTCGPNGQSCRFSTDCCSLRCQGAGGPEAYCLPSGTCSAPGAECEIRNSCCSGRCEPGGPHGSLLCGPFCQANGSPCDDAQDCCSLACHGGICGGSICGVIGSACIEDSGCCSGRCDSGRCAMTTEPCFPSGESCGGDTGAYCCSNWCDGTTGRCDLGPGNCREASSPCTVDTDCCRGKCQTNAEEGVPVCTAACLGPGVGCDTNGDCCAGTCGGAPSTCRSCP
jgi:hypothetical protein